MRANSLPRLVLLAGVCLSTVTLASDRAVTSEPPKPELVVLRGKVVELGPHLLETFAVPIDEDQGKAAVVLVTDSGEVHPLIKDIRSRGFFLDERIRNRQMELVVHKYARLPFVRVIDVHSYKDGRRHKLDYWCDICAIITFQPGECPCCQGEVELREQAVADEPPTR